MHAPSGRECQSQCHFTKMFVFIGQHEEIHAASGTLLTFTLYQSLREHGFHKLNLKCNCISLPIRWSLNSMELKFDHPLEDTVFPIFENGFVC